MTVMLKTETLMEREQINRLANPIRDLRADLERNPELRLDSGTTDFLTAVLQEHEAAAWMLLSLDWKNTSLKSWLNEQEKVTYGRVLPGEVLMSTTAEGEMT
jgi:hypothetical protein